MKKGLKKYTVEFSIRFFDGGGAYGQQVVFAENTQKAERKVKSGDCTATAHKWQAGEKSEYNEFPAFPAGY